MSKADSKILANLQKTAVILIIFLYVINLVIGFFVLFGRIYAINFVITSLILILAVGTTILGTILENRTRLFGIINVVCAVITYIPFIGFFSAIIGVTASLISLGTIFGMQMAKKLNNQIYSSTGMDPDKDSKTRKGQVIDVEVED